MVILWSRSSQLICWSTAGAQGFTVGARASSAPLPCAATDPTTQVVARCTEADQCMQSACMPVYTVEGWSITVKARSKLRQQDLVFPATAFSVAASL